MGFKDIPLEDWSQYPKIKPKEPGYYLTLYYNPKEDIEYYKCLYWAQKQQNWIWREPSIVVKCFVEKTRTDFYCPCVEKVEELYFNKPQDIENA